MIGLTAGDGSPLRCAVSGSYPRPAAELPPRRHPDLGCGTGGWRFVLEKASETLREHPLTGMWREVSGALGVDHSSMLLVELVSRSQPRCHEANPANEPQGR